MLFSRRGSTVTHKTSLFDPSVDRDLLRVTTFLVMDDGKLSLDFWDPTSRPPAPPSAPVVHTCAAPTQYIVKPSTNNADLRALRLLRARRLLLPPKVMLSYEEMKRKRALDRSLMPPPAFIPAHAVKRYYAQHHTHQVVHVHRAVDGERPGPPAAPQPQPATSLWDTIKSFIPSCLKRKRVAGDDDVQHKRARLVPTGQPEESDSDGTTPPRRASSTPRRVTGRRPKKLASFDLPSVKVESAAILSIFDRFISSRDTPAAQSVSSNSMPAHWAHPSIYPRFDPCLPNESSGRFCPRDPLDLRLPRADRAPLNRVQSCSSWFCNAVRDFLTSDWGPVVDRYPYAIDEFSIYEVLPGGGAMEIG